MTRCIIIDKGIPSKGDIDANMHQLARYAALCQEAGLVSIVEPEVLMDGEHSMKKCYNVTEKALRMLFRQLTIQKVDLRAVILKPNMVFPGRNSPKQVTVEKVAKATVACLIKNVPATVPGVAFLYKPEMERCGNLI